MKQEPEGAPRSGADRNRLRSRRRGCQDRDFTLVQEDDRPVRLTVKRVPGWSLVELDHTTNTVTLPPGVSLDLGATAKAWAADRAAGTLARTADCDILVSLGGDTAVAGEPPAGGWRIRVQDETAPVDRLPEHGPYATVGIRGGGLATSGTTARRRGRPRPPPHRRPPHGPTRRHPMAHRLGGRRHRRRRRHHRRPGQGRDRGPLAVPPGAPRPTGHPRGHGRHHTGLALPDAESRARRMSDEILW